MVGDLEDGQGGDLEDGQGDDQEGDQEDDQAQLLDDQGALPCPVRGQGVQGADTPQVLSTGAHYWGAGGHYWGAEVVLQAWVLGSSVTLLVSTPTATTTTTAVQ